MIASLALILLSQPPDRLEHRATYAPWLKLDVVTDKPEYKAGEPVKVTVRLSNSGPHPVIVARANPISKVSPIWADLTVEVNGDTKRAARIPSTYETRFTGSQIFLKQDDFEEVASQKSILLVEEALTEVWVGEAPRNRAEARTAKREPLPTGKYTIKVAWKWSRSDVNKRLEAALVPGSPRRLTSDAPGKQRFDKAYEGDLRGEARFVVKN